MSYLNRIKQAEEEKRKQGAAVTKPQSKGQTGADKAEAGLKPRVNASAGTVKSASKTDMQRKTVKQNTAVPGMAAIGKNAGVGVTWGTLNSMKKSGAIPSNADMNSQQTGVHSGKNAQGGFWGKLSTEIAQSTRTAQGKKALMSAAHTNLNAPASPGELMGAGTHGGVSGNGEKNTGLVGGIADEKRQREQNAGKPEWYIQSQQEIKNTGEEISNISAPQAVKAQSGWDYTGGQSAREKTEALMPIIEKSEYYKQNKALISAQEGEYDARIREAEKSILSAGADYAGTGALRAERNKLKMQRYIAQDRLYNLADETRVRMTDAGEISGSVTPEEKIRYNLDQRPRAQGAAGFLGTLGLTTATTGHQAVDSTPRDIATAYVTAMAALSGVQSPVDWLEAHPDQKQIFDRAYSPTQDLSDYSGSFGSNGWDTFQKLEQSAAESLKTMAISYGLGAVGAGSAGAATQQVTRIMQWVNSGISAAAGAAREAAAAGADAHETGAAFLFTGIANAYLEQGGADKVFENAARLGQNVAGTRVGSGIASRLCPAGVKKVIDGIKASKFGGIYEAGLDVFKSFFSEGFEEIAEDAVGNTIAKAVYDPDRPWTGEGGVFDAQQYAEDGLIGGSMGAAFTIIGGLLMPGQYRANLLANSALNEVQQGGQVTPEQISEINAAINDEIRMTEKTAGDVDAHAGIWQANGQQAPESLKAWRAAAMSADKAQSAYDAARNAVEQLISDMETGALDTGTAQGVKTYNAVMAEYSAASEQLNEAARANVSAREEYYKDEDTLNAQLEGSAGAAAERVNEITKSVRETAGAGDADMRKLETDEARAAIREADEAIMRRDALAGETEQAARDEMSAPTPAQELEIRQRRRALSAEYENARIEAEAAKARLMETIKNDSPERQSERMEDGRARNRDAGLYDAVYDDISTQELSSERERLAKRLEQLQGEMEDAHGSRYKRLKRELERVSDKLNAANAEIELRSEVYGERPDGIGKVQAGGMPEGIEADAPVSMGVQGASPTLQMRTEVQNRNTPAELRTMANGYMEVFTPDGQVDIERAQQMLNNANTGVTYKPAGEYSADEIRNIQMYLQSVDGNIVDLCEQYRLNKNGKFKRYTISPVTDMEVSDILTLTGTDVSGYVHAIDKNAFNHIDKRHGVNGEHDKSMANASDVARIGYVLANYDSVEMALNEDGAPDTAAGYRDANDIPAKKLVYSKKINGTMYVIETVCDNAYKKLWTITAYLKNDNKKRGLRQTSDVTSPRLTSETIFPSRPSNINIPRADVNVNRNTPAELRTMANGYMEVFTPDGQVDIERAQQMLNNANTGVTYKPAGEYSADEIRNIQMYLQSVDGKLLSIADSIIDGYDAQPVRIPLCEVNENAVEAIRNIAGFDAGGYEFYIQKSELRHIVGRHGNMEADANTYRKYHDKALGNHSDIARIGYVLSNFDNYKQLEDTKTVQDKYRNNAKTIRFEKKVNGTYYVVTAIAEQNQYKRLWVQSCFFDDSSADKMGQKNMRKLRGPDILKAVGNVQNGSASLSSQNIVSQTGGNVNDGAEIYKNGRALFSSMTNEELDAEIALEGQSAGQEGAGERLDMLRSERAAREGSESAQKRRNAQRLSEIEEMLNDVPGAEDGELSRHARYLRRRAAQLDSEIEIDKDSGEDVKKSAVELERVKADLESIQNEMKRRADARGSDMESLIDEIREENPGHTRADSELERARIRENQSAGREELEQMKAERDKKRPWRTTDTITPEEAARVFKSGKGAQEGVQDADMDSILRQNRDEMGKWETRRAQLSEAESELREELKGLNAAQERMARIDAQTLTDEDMRERISISERIARIERDLNQATGLRQQVEGSIRYLRAHAGDGVIETMQSGRLPEQMMERIMGYVDEMHMPASGAVGMHMNTPARVFDDVFGDAAPIMRAIYIEPIANHEAERQKYIGNAREKIEALKLNKAERELVQRVGEGVMTAGELDEAIDAALARRGARLKGGDGQWAEEADASAAPNARTVEDARAELDKAISANPLASGHEYRAGDYDELIKKVKADGGTHSGAEWEKILGFSGNNPRVSNLERFVHNTQERVLAANDGKTTKAEARNATIDSSELLDFMRNEMAEDAKRMTQRRRFTEQLLAKTGISVSELKTPTIDIRKPFSEAKKVAGFETAINADTGVEISLNGDGYKKTRKSIENLSTDLRMPAIAALENFNILIPNSVYVGSYSDYGNSQNMVAMHCFVAPFRYDGSDYRAMYSAKEIRNNDGSYSTKLYLQRVEAIKAQKNVAYVENRTISSNETERAKHYINDATRNSIHPQDGEVNDVQRVEALRAQKEQRSLKTSTSSAPQGINYISTSAADSSIHPQGGEVNTIDAQTLLDGYNLNALKAWPLAQSEARVQDAGAEYAGWGDKADEVRRINHAVKVFGEIYEDIYHKVNDAYVRNGYEAMGKRKNYFPHFQQEEGGAFEKIARKLGFGGGQYALPTSIDGLTETFSPGRTYNKHAQHRLGHDTAFDAIKGFEDYIDQSTKAAYLTDDIKRLRQLERDIRAGEESGTLTRRGTGKANGDLGSLAKWVHEYANLIAGKKSSLDRGVESYVGRKAYQTLNIIRGHRGAAAVAGNISSALTNIAPVVQVASEHPVATVKGMMGMMCELMRGDSDIPESAFLTRRFASDQLGVGRMAKIENIATKPFEIVDTIASNIVVRGCYQANIDAGMEPEAAMRAADAQAARLMADRSLGQMPNVYNSRLFMGVLGQFQLEVANNVKWMQDITRSYSPGRTAAVFGLLAIMSKLTNEAWKQLTGRDLMLDPISAVEEGISAGRDRTQTDGAWQGMWAGLSAGFNELSGNLPYISDGRVGTNLIGDAVDAVGTVKSAIEEGASARAWDTVFWQMMNYVSYGGQFKKSYQGEGALMAGGVYDKTGRLMYPVDASNGWTRVQALIFGKSSTEYARKYYDEGRAALSAENTQRYMALTQSGISPYDAYDTLYAYQQVKGLYNKVSAAEKAGDDAQAARLRAEMENQLRHVDYEAVIPAGLEGEMGREYAQMLKDAYLESGNDAFMPEYYKGEFTKDKVKSKFTPESMEKISEAYSVQLNAQMQAYADTWAQMSDNERKDAYAKCKEKARAVAKDYGINAGLEYVSMEEYEKRGYQAPENAQGSTAEPVGLTNPVNDAYRALTGESDAMKSALKSSVTGGTPVAVGAEASSVSADGNAGALSADEISSLNSIAYGSGKRTRRTGTSRRRSGSASSRRASAGGTSGGMTVGTPEATVQMPWYKTRMYESFGNGYNPFPLTNSFTWRGQSVKLKDGDMETYAGLYDAYMDIYMRERQQEWDAKDSAGREEMLREMDARARDAAYENMKMQ